MKVKVEKIDTSTEEEKEKLLKLLFMREIQGACYRDIGGALNWSKSKAQYLYAKCEEKNITYEVALEMAPEDLVSSIEGKKTETYMIEISEDVWIDVSNKLARNSRMTLKYYWNNYYIPQNPDGLGYSQFNKRYRNWKKESSVEIILPQERVPGKELFIDWVGDTLEIYDSDGNKYAVYLFIGTMGDSSYPYVEAFLRMDQISWTQAHVRMLNYYGGVPRLFVPDNTKTAIISPKLYDPDLNHAYRALAEYYGIGIAPARVRKPKDKGSVEAGVKFIENNLMVEIKENGKIYYDLNELNYDIQEIMKKLVVRPFKQRSGSRKSVFEALDKPELRPLPLEPFVYFETITKNSLPANWHFDIKEKGETFYYSFPYIYVRMTGYAHVYSDKVEIYVKGVGLVASHQRRFVGKRYITDMNHAPKNQQERMKYNQRTGVYYREKAGKIGQFTYKVIDYILTSGPVEEQGYKSCDGIIRMADNHGYFTVEEACKQAYVIGKINYTQIKNLVNKETTKKKNKNTSTQESDSTSTVSPAEMEHENLRTDEWR